MPICLEFALIKGSKSISEQTMECAHCELYSPNSSMNTWPTVILVTTLAVISPGADFTLVTRTSLMVSRRAGLLVALGIGSGVLVHVGYTLLGMGMLLHRLPWLFATLKWLGAGYLVWLGISLWRQAGSTIHTGGVTAPSVGIAANHWRQGFLTNALNPKTALFIVSLFTQVAGPGVATAMQLAQGLFIAAAHVLWFALVAWFFSTPALQPRVQSMRPWIDRSLGGVLMGLGVLLIGTAMPQWSW